MTQIIGLFSDQKKAGTAVAKLTNAELGEHQIHVIEEGNGETKEQMAAAPAISPDSGIAGWVVTSIKTAPKLDLSKEEVDYFNRTLLKGGVLVVIDLADDAYAPKARQILDKQDGRVTAV